MAKPFSEMPTASCLISNALKLTSVDFHRKVYALAEKHGGIFKIQAPGRTVVVLTDPAALAAATSMEFTGVDKPADIYNTFALLCSSSTPPTYPVLGIGNHITPEDNDGEKKWQTLRSGFDAAFSAKAVPQYVPTLVEEAGKVLSQVGSQSLDMLELVGRISLSTTGRIMFGYDAFECTDLTKPCDFWREIITARKGAVGIARSPLVKLQQKLCPFSHAVQDYKDSLDAVHKKYEEIYSEMEGRAAAAGAAAAAAAGGPPTILQAFQTTPDYRYPDNRMSKDDTIAMIGNLVVAGTLPAGTAAAYTLCLIACHPEVQAKVHAELDAAGLSSSSGGGRAFEASDVAKLPYLANVIKEAMRINSAVPQVNRAAAADIELGGYKIPKGTLMFLSMGGMHASPHNFSEPHRFYPERWEQQQPAVAASDGADAAGGTATWTGNSKDLAGSYTPFSSGIRACLGQHWARLAIPATVASVLARFQLTSPHNMTAESLAAGETFSVSIYPRTPLLLTFTPRTAA